MATYEIVNIILITILVLLTACMLIVLLCDLRIAKRVGKSTMFWDVIEQKEERKNDERRNEK